MQPISQIVNDRPDTDLVRSYPLELLRSPDSILMAYVQRYLGEVSGSMKGQNNDILQQRASRFIPSESGLESKTFIEFVQGARLHQYWDDLDKQKIAFDDRIDKAIINAGENLVIDLDNYLVSNPGTRDPERKFLATQILLALAPHYASEKSEEYIQRAKQLRSETINGLKGSLIQTLRGVAVKDFDPFATPAIVREAAGIVYQRLNGYGLDKSELEHEVEGVVKGTYNRAYEALKDLTIKRIQSLHPNESDQLIGNSGKLLTLDKPTFDSGEEALESRVKVVELDPDLVIAESMKGVSNIKPQKSDIPEDAKKYQIRRLEDIGEDGETRILYVAGKSGNVPRSISVQPTAPIENPADSGVNIVGGRSVEDSTLYFAINLEKLLTNSLPQILEHIRFTLDYGRRAGVNTNSAKRSFLQAVDSKKGIMEQYAQLFSDPNSEDYNPELAQQLVDLPNTIIDNIKGTSGRKTEDTSPESGNMASRFIRRIKNRL